MAIPRDYVPWATVRAVRADGAADEARRLLAEAEEIRRARQYAIPPVDQPLAGATRARLSAAG